MRLSSFKKCKDEYQNIGGWSSSLDAERQKVLGSFPYSVVVEGEYTEHDRAKDWCQKNIGLNKEKWNDLWYGKTDYNFGFAEFFFLKEDKVISFSKAVSSFYADYTSSGGKKWKTNGPDKLISIN